MLVLVHEWGHFFTAKSFGIRVDEFGFGFPPKMLTLFKKGETEYTLNWLPIGGFVKIFGENPDDENTNGPDKDRSFVNKPKWQQAIVLFAGIFMNFVLAWVLFSFGLMSGLPMSAGSAPEGVVLENTNLVVVSVMPESPAEVAGLISGDKITNISIPYSSNSADSISNPKPEDVISLVSNNPENEFTVTLLRGEEEKVFTLKPKKDPESGRALLGVSMDQIGIAKMPIHTAFIEGVGMTYFVTKGTIIGLYGLIADGIRGNGSLDGVAGPVGMVGIVGDAYKFGFAYLLSFAALISVNLAIINLVPFPALDGGRLFFLLIETVKGSRINPKIANTANIIGFAILILLMLFVTYHDVVKLF